MNTKKRNIYFLTDFIRTHPCASLDSRIGRCHQRQTWRYQGATVEPDTRGSRLVEAVAVVAGGAALHCRLNLNEIYVQSTGQFTHSFACSALPVSLTRFAGLIRSLARTRAHRKEVHIQEVNASILVAVMVVVMTMFVKTVVAVMREKIQRFVTFFFFVKFGDGDGSDCGGGASGVGGLGRCSDSGEASQLKFHLRSCFRENRQDSMIEWRRRLQRRRWWQRRWW